MGDYQSVWHLLRADYREAITGRMVRSLVVQLVCPWDRTLVDFVDSLKGCWPTLRGYRGTGIIIDDPC